MFTGIIEEIGTINRLSRNGDGARLLINAKKVLNDVKLGDSIATNGVCLTVTAYNSHSFQVDVMAETMRRSNLKYLKVGSPVNLERALRLGSRLGGHWVTGHIDDMGTIVSFQQEHNAQWITIKPPKTLVRYMILKGSIAIDGVSLTIQYVDSEEFKVSIIPHTKDETLLLRKKIGDSVNLECDLIGKYVEKLIKVQTEEKSQNSGLTMEVLTQNGFN